jgi:hypothetical protein
MRHNSCDDLKLRGLPSRLLRAFRLEPPRKGPGRLSTGVRAIYERTKGPCAWDRYALGKLSGGSIGSG